MRYVFGMAKSPLDLRGGKARSLELDFVRLVLAVRTETAAGNTAHGYLLVLDERVASRVRRWQERYEAEELVTVLRREASGEAMHRLREEKRRNALGIVPRPAQPAASSVASLGERIGEEALRVALAELEPGVVELPPEVERPLGVKWDFYGSREDVA
mgnify:CR=1 FL=1